MTPRQARIEVIRKERDKLQSQISALDTEHRELRLAEDRDLYPCSCVKLNRDIEVFDMQEQERRNRTPVNFASFVADSLSAKKDCGVCKGKGIPVVPEVFHTCETFNPDGCAACRVIQRNID